MLYNQDTFPCKTHRQYLTRNLNAKQRASAIVSHYRYVSSLSNKALSSALISREETILAEFTGRELVLPFRPLVRTKQNARASQRYGCVATIKNCSPARPFCRVREGRMAFRHWWPARSWTTCPHETIKEATRALSGIFPKRVLIEFISHLADLTAVRAIYGVSDNGHVFRSLRYRMSKGRHLHASYDDFWSLIGGVKQNSWRWQLPLTFERKSLEHIPSKSGRSIADVFRS